MSNDTLEFECAPRDVGRIIGTKGVNIRALEAGTGCRVKTPQQNFSSGSKDGKGGKSSKGKGKSSGKDKDNNSESFHDNNMNQNQEEPSVVTVRIIGSTQQKRERCKEAIDGLLMGEEVVDVLARLDGGKVLKNLDPTVLNRVGELKREVEEKLFVGVTVQLEAKSAIVWGPPSSESSRKDNSTAKGSSKGSNGKPESQQQLSLADRAVAYLQDAIDDLQTASQEIIRVDPPLVPLVLQDTALRQLMDSTGLQISVSKDDQGTGIRLSGLIGAISEAKKLIECRIINNAGPGGSGGGLCFLPLAAGLVDNMGERAWWDLDRDVKSMEEHCGVSVEWESGRAKIGGEKCEIGKGELMNILQYNIMIILKNFRLIIFVFDLFVF